MNTILTKTLLAASLSALLMPSLVHADEAELLNRIEALARELAELKSQVEAGKARTDENVKSTEAVQKKIAKVEDRSLAKWLDLGGDYQFRVDSLQGKTRTFTDVKSTFDNAQQALQADFFANPSTEPGSSTFFGGMGLSTAGALSALMQFSQNMGAVQNYQQASAFLADPMNAGLVQGIGGFAATLPAFKPDNATLYTNRFGLDMHIKATQNVVVTTRLLMYKTFGANDASAVTNAGSAPFFADRVGTFDGTLGHIPSSDFLNVDRAYATWSNIFEQNLWFSVGRRPSSDGVPRNLKQNRARPGNGGTPSLLVDYAFDGMSLGYAPDSEALPGAYLKLCYGRGFESGFRSPPNNSLDDTDMFGIQFVPIDTDPLRIWTQWNRGFNIFDAPVMRDTFFGNTLPETNLGDLEWWGAGAIGVFADLGQGDLNYFAEIGHSITHPNNNVSSQFGFQGLLTGGFFNPEAPSSKTGTAIALGLRYDLAYDLPATTKIGFEYNHGSKNWITFAPAADDVWTSKVGTRGNVYDAYVILQLNKKALASYDAKAFFRLGFQYYDFNYSGSNNWVGAPVKLSEVNGQLMTTTPLDHAYDLYGTFEVIF
ncbi:MAG: DUF3373 domain-containing protein [Lysobacterales bacterium]